MPTYSDGYIQFSYPDSFKIEKGKGGKFGNFKKFDIGDLIVRLTNPETKSSIQFCPRTLSFDKAYSTRCDPTSPQFNTPQIEVIRAGDYCQFLGAKEIFLKGIMAPDSQSGYHWIIMTPMLRICKTLEIYVSEYNNKNDFTHIWIPIVKSLELNSSPESPFGGFGIPAGTTKYIEQAMKTIIAEVQTPEATPPPINTNIKRHKWAKIFKTKKQQHFNYTICPENGYISFYDSSLRGALVSESLFGFYGESAQQVRAIKSEKCTVILPSDALDMVMDFYLNSEAPDELDSRWEQVIESIMTIDSGKMYVEAQSLPEVELVMNPGNYKLRVYFGVVNIEEDSLNIALYFWPTVEKETNEVKIIKALDKGILLP